MIKSVVRKARLTSVPEVSQHITHVKTAPPGRKITEVTSRTDASWRVSGKLGQEVIIRKLTASNSCKPHLYVPDLFPKGEPKQNNASLHNGLTASFVLVARRDY
jgi:hypothetical protein